MYRFDDTRFLNSNYDLSNAVEISNVLAVSSSDPSHYASIWFGLPTAEVSKVLLGEVLGRDVRGQPSGSHAGLPNG